MKYLFINSAYGVNSTGKIVAKKCRELQEQGHTCVAAWGRDCRSDGTVETWRISSKFECQLHGVMTRLFDNHGFASHLGTAAFLKRVEAYGPDVVWLHNIHGYYIHVGMLFDWLKKHPGVKVYWTLHDCWAFTGHCPHFTVAKCGRWKTQCEKCPQKDVYPTSYWWDGSRRNYIWKKKAFTGVKDLTLITPSRWLADLTRQSFLKEYPVEVVYNTIDTNVFKPTHSDFREKNGIGQKKMVLGCASVFEETKGSDDMVLLREKLPEDYVIVLIGVPAEAQKTMPEGILCVTQVTNQQELAGIYTAADVFVNPTHQDNFPTVNLESRACGTPVVTYRVGGSPESAGGEHIVEENDVDGLAAEVRKICEG